MLSKDVFMQFRRFFFGRFYSEEGFLSLLLCGLHRSLAHRLFVAYCIFWLIRRKKVNSQLNEKLAKMFILFRCVFVYFWFDANLNYDLSSENFCSFWKVFFFCSDLNSGTLYFLYFRLWWSFSNISKSTLFGPSCVLASWRGRAQHVRWGRKKGTGPFCSMTAVFYGVEAALAEQQKSCSLLCSSSSHFYSLTVLHPPL